MGELWVDLEATPWVEASEALEARRFHDQIRRGRDRILIQLLFRATADACDAYCSSEVLRGAVTGSASAVYRRRSVALMTLRVQSHLRSSLSIGGFATEEPPVQSMGQPFQFVSASYSWPTFGGLYYLVFL